MAEFGGLFPRPRLSPYSPPMCRVSRTASVPHPRWMRIY